MAPTRLEIPGVEMIDVLRAAPPSQRVAASRGNPLDLVLACTT